MTTTTPFLITVIGAIATYLSATAYLIHRFRSGHQTNPTALFAFLLVGLALHGAATYQAIDPGNALSLDILSVGTLIFWVINTLVLLSGLNKPLHNLYIFLFPLSAAALLGAVLTPQQPSQEVLDTPLIVHILLSVVAYSLFTIATLQAVLLAYQNHQLKIRKPNGAIRLLPPLQTMETLLFEVLWIGQIGLTLSIATGIIFIEDFLGQQLAHKTFFSVVAWVVFAILLWGRHQLGWRGNTALRWTLCGFCALMLAYFGSKFIIDYIIN